MIDGFTGKGSFPVARIFVDVGVDVGFGIQLRKIQAFFLVKSVKFRCKIVFSAFESWSKRRLRQPSQWLGFLLASVRRCNCTPTRSRGSRRSPTPIGGLFVNRFEELLLVRLVVARDDHGREADAHPRTRLPPAMALEVERRRMPVAGAPVTDLLLLHALVTPRRRAILSGGHAGGAGAQALQIAVQPCDHRTC